MAELLANVAIVGAGGRPEPYYLARWRTVAVALPTWRALLPAVRMVDQQGNPTVAYQELFYQVFRLSIDPKNPIVDTGDGKPTKSHRDDWAKIP